MGLALQEEAERVTTHEVYAYGVVSSSALYRIHGTFPAAEGYAEIADAQRMTGGESTNSSVVLARLGARVRLDGNWLGADDNGRRTKALLTSYGIDTTRLPLREGYRGVQEVVFSAGGTRTIFGTYGHLLEAADWNTPQESDIAQAKVVCLDPFFEAPASRVAEVAFSAGIPVVTVDCPFDAPLLEATSAVVIAQSFLKETYGERDLEEVFREYQGATQGLVVFTFGDAGGWYARGAGEPHKSFESYPVDAVDTAGAGDSFRAGIVYGCLQGWEDDASVDFAAALAAVVCTRFPGVVHAPTREEVAEFAIAAGRGDAWV